MSNIVRRIYVEKKPEYSTEAKTLYKDLKDNLGIDGLLSLRIVNRYDISGISNEEYNASKFTIFSEPPVDYAYDEELEVNDKDMIFAVEYLPGQYDQRADSASQCLQILTQNEKPNIKTAKVIILTGEISVDEFNKIKSYSINPVDSRESSLKKPDTLHMPLDIPMEVQVLDGFINKNLEELNSFKDTMGLAMSYEDLKFCQDYFSNIENRNPTLTEIKVIDTYWSDHCRHTTFHASIEKVSMDDSPFCSVINDTYNEYLKSRQYVYGENKKEICLMDLAVIGMKELRKKGQLEDIDISDEINACSINVNVDVDGETEKWLVMFKNETHNHPTEIEPFGGAATCLGGAIRDPLSGRAYVYQAMRVTGSGDPRTRVMDTLQGKLPQRKITRGAAAGYSSYGNQIGLATGHVSEVYDEGFVAKRMEVGAVIGAVPKKNVRRETPCVGDSIILLGGRTGRDGCGGATGSSKEHTEESILTCGAEVQKGNPPTERKIQRLFRNKDVSMMIKRCNDFGAGGVSVAIGELADSLDINLDLVPKKYEGLDGTELAISESQERMAVVVSKEDVDRFIDYAKTENLEAIEVAEVTSKGRLRMMWKGSIIVDIKRDFLDTNGVRQTTGAFVTGPDMNDNYFDRISYEVEKEIGDLNKAWMVNLENLNVCSQKGLIERFDSTIGAGTVLMPFGGKYQLTPAECMAAKIPVLLGDTNTGTLMSYGYNPLLSKWSPFHGALYAIIETAAKIVAAGGNYKNIRLSFQEYFEKLGKDEKKWGKPLSALLGAYYAQMRLGIPAIGGKDSMSGTFKDLNVPPTLVAFGVDTVDVNKVISPEFKKPYSKVVLMSNSRDEYGLPNFEKLDKMYSKITKLIGKGKILAAHTIKTGGLAEAISKMCFGNKIGFEFKDTVDPRSLFAPDYGSIVLELGSEEELQEILVGVEYSLLGYTNNTNFIKVNMIEIDIDRAINAWEKPLEKIFPTKTEKIIEKPINVFYNKRNNKKPLISFAKPRVLVTVFPGTNCEYDSAKAFEKAGAQVDTVIFKNLSTIDIEDSIKLMVHKINNSQIIMIPGGFSGGDEPDGSGKFIATVFRNPRIKEAVMEFLKNKDGLMLGICNGFQALIKLGLLPYGEIREQTIESPTLTYNTIGRHISHMAKTKVVSTLSPWLKNVNVGDIHTIAVSHGEGRFVATQSEIEAMAAHGQIVTQYVDFDGNPDNDILYNSNGSMHAIEGITSSDGRILGKMGHSERIGTNVAKNIHGEKDQYIFEAGVEYFKF